MAGGGASGSKTQELVVEAFGVRVRVVVDDPDLEAVRELLPPGSQPCPAEDLHATFTLKADSLGSYELTKDGELVGGGSSRAFVLDNLERQIHSLVALEAPAHIFVHAGVVGLDGAAMLIPGSSHTGKTSLVAALVRAGATYYSDEFGPLDATGDVHPFARPLAIRNERFEQVNHDVVTLGGVAGEGPLPVACVVITTFEPGAQFHPRQLSSGEAMLALLAHTVPAQTRPDEALQAINRALAGATAIQGPRGDADAVAPSLLAELERAR
jgi:hypothetical protein